MADNIESRIDLNIDVSNALASIKTLQAQISAFHQSIRNSGNAVNQAVSDNLTKNLLNNINATQKFSASLTTVSDTTQSFTNALEKNKLSLGQYFKYGAASTKSFGRLFKSEFNTIEKVARDRVKTLQTQFIRMGRDSSGALEAIKVRPLKLDMEQLGTQVAMTAQKQQLFNQLLKQGSTNLLNFGKNTQWAGRQLMVGFTIPLSIMGSMAIKEFDKIERQAIRFKRVYGDAFTTDAETDAAIENMRRLATEFTKYGIEVEKTLELAADVAQMGLRGSELTAQVTEATRLAVLGEVEQQEALQATISVTNAFGVAAEELAEKIDFLNAVENETLTAISDLTIAIPKAGPVVKQLGGDVEDLAFFLTAMKEGGINASEGANALKSGLAKLINPTEKASLMLQGFGINLTNIVEQNAGDIRSTVLQFASALDTLDPLNRARAIEELFGRFQFARISTLFDNITKEGSQAQRVLELANKSSAELAILSERELKRIEDSPVFKLQKAIEKMQEALAPLGAEFIKIITPLIEFGTKILKSFNNMSDGAKAFVTNIITVLGLIAPVAIMTFGLLANGLANLIKGLNVVRTFFGKLAGAGTGLNQMTQYMTMEQLEATAAASSLGQAHSTLTTVFTSERTALDGLVRSYNNAIVAMRQYQAQAAQQRVRPPGNTQTKKYASGVLSVPGPKGAGDVIPAMLSPGEAVIPAEEAQKYRGFIQQMISGKLPGFRKGFLGMPKSAKAVSKDRSAAEAIYQKFLQSGYRNTPPTEYGHQLAKTTGHSFPIFGLGGVYALPSGKRVFVKPVIDEKSALAEMRGTQITRMAHDLEAPNQKIVVMRDPTDLKRKRRFLALQSDLDLKFVNSDEKAVFNSEQYFRQLLASLVRGDKDLSAGNVFGNVVADVGPAGVFTRASGERDYDEPLSMEDQATVNLLGVRGGAKKAFAQSTVGLMGGMNAEQYHQNMLREIRRVIPKLRQTIAGFNLTDPAELKAYNGMVRRLEEGLGVDWRRFHAMHSNVKVPGFKDGVFNLAGPRGAGDVIPAMIAPGESVISSDMTQKYAPLIRGIITDSLPGFSESKPGYMYNPSDPLVETHLQSPSPIIPGRAGFKPQLVGSLMASKPGLGSAPQEIQENITALGELIAMLPRKLNENLKREGGVAIEQFNAAWDGTSDKLTSTIAAGMKELGMSFSPTNPVMQAEIAELEAKIKQNVNALAAAAGGKVTDATVSAASDAAIAELAPTNRAARAAESRSNTLREYRTSFAKPDLVSGVKGGTMRIEDTVTGGGKIVEANSGITIGRVASRGGLTPQEQMKGYKQNPSIIEKMGLRQESKFVTGPKISEVLEDPEELKVAGKDIGKKIIAGIKQGADEEGKMASPSREMFERGKNLVRGMVDGVQEEIRRSTGQAAPPRQDLPKPPSLPGFEQVETPKVVNPELAKGKSIGKKFVNKTEAFLDNQIMGDGAFAKTAMGQNLKQAFDINNGDLDDQLGIIEGETDLERNQRALLAQRENVVAAEQGNLIQEQFLNDEEGRLLEEETINLRHEDGSLKTRRELIAEEEALRKRKAQAEKRTQRENLRAERKLIAQDRAQKRQARAGKALGALGTATMVVGMATQVEGVVGETAQKILPALAGLSAVAPLLLALPLPLALLAGAVGAVAFGLYKWNDIINKAREEGLKLGDALSMSTDKLIKFSEATGKVSATEERRKQQLDQRTGTTEAQRKFGQTFLESEAGKQMLTDIGTVNKNSMGAVDGAKALGNQLATMVMQGVVDSGEASSIAAAIGLELGDQTFSANVVATLIDLIGPNGEDLKNEPLEVALKIQKQSGDLLSELSAFALNENQMSESVKNTIAEERAKRAQEEAAAKAQRDARFDSGDMLAGLEGWAADWFGLKPLSEMLADATGFESLLSLEEGTDPEYLIRFQEEKQKLQSASIQLGINQLQQNQQLLDSFNKQYDAKEAELKASIAITKDIEKKKKLEKELFAVQTDRNRGLKDLNDANADSINQILDLRESYSDDAFAKAISQATLGRFAEDDPRRVLMEDTLKNVERLKDEDLRAEIQLGLATGELEMSTVQSLLQFGEDGEVDIDAKFKVAVERKGFAEANQILSLATQAGMGGDQVGIVLDFITSSENTQEVERQLAALAEMAQLPTEYGIGIDIRNGDEAVSILGQVAYVMERLEDQPEKITRTALMDMNVDGEFNDVLAKWETLVGQDDTISKTMIFEFLTFMKSDDQSLVDYYLQATGQGALIGTMLANSGAFDAQSVAWLMNRGKNTAGTSGSGEGEGDGSGQGTDPLANILSKLKEIRNAAINAGGGVTELLRVLGDSAKEMKTFRGVSQKLLATGYTREFIDAIMSMDENTRKTFVSIEDGVISVTEAGRALNKGFSEQSLGEYQNSLAETAIGINAQVTAMTKLTGEGVPLATAIQMVQDKNLALAIASDATTEEIWSLKKAFDAAAEAEQSFANATPEGRRGELESVISEANAFFSAQETFQNQRYDAAVKAYEDANGIVEAQRDLADKEFELDDLSYALDQISKQEEKINDEYDKREEAIENIYKANKAIIDQDKEKLNIADALASGDLAAAAKAMREQSTANLERNKEAQLDNLQRSRELELAQIRDEQGRSRLELETSIRDIQDEIAQIQEDKLEPYQRELDLLDRIRQDALKDVQDTGFLGLTQARWAEIANEVERAKFGVDDYMESLRTRLKAIPGVEVGEDGSISVDENQIVAPEVSPKPTTTDDTQLTATNPNQEKIDDLNRLILITRKRVREGDYTDNDQKQRLMRINMQRIRDVRSLGGIAAAMGGLIPYMRMGGLLPYKAEGGSIFKSLGTDTVPAMLTPGEFVVRRHAVSNFGVDKLRAINSGTYNGESVYNYSVNVNVKSDANPDEIARSVMGQIKRIDSQRIRGNKF